MLNLIRRHTPSCPRKSDRHWTKCSCPIWFDGYVDGIRDRGSLKTRDWERAKRRLKAREDEQDSPTAAPKVLVETSVQLFLQHKSDNARGTNRNARRILTLLQSIAAASNITTLDQLTLEFFTHYRLARPINTRTWAAELKVVKSWLRFTKSRYKVPDFEISDIRPPKVKETVKTPYTEDEVAAILRACDTFGQRSYERLRARAIVLLLHHTAMRKSDIARLRQDQLRGGELRVRTLKNDEDLWFPLPPDVIAALHTVPLPQGADPSCPYFFWHGRGNVDTLDRHFSRTLDAVFEKSGVVGAHAHRFRHTLATRLLERGYTFDDVALVLGSTPAVIQKHYAQWSQGRQKRVTEMMRGGNFSVTK